MEAREDTIRRYWRLMDAGSWEELLLLLADRFEVCWPQSGMRFAGKESFVAMNRAYPGEGRIDLLRVSPLGDDQVVTEVSLDWQSPGKGSEALFAVSFFTFSGDKISSAREYWANCHEPPDWQSGYGTRPASLSSAAG